MEYLVISLLESDFDEALLKSSLLEIFHITESDLSNLFKGNYSLIKYEIRKLVNYQDFNIEIIIYVPKEVIIENTIFNNLIIGSKISKLLNIEVLINDESDDPYQCILINKDNIYLVEEQEDECETIRINRSFAKRMNYQKALNLLPGRDYILTDKSLRPVYYVLPSNLWNKCILSSDAPDERGK